MISVIIPAVNEAAQLPATFASLRIQAEPHEVIVVDAGSADETAAIAEKNGARVLAVARRQRASQMNAGAEAARGDTLLFPHADTRLAPGALARIAAALQDPIIAG